MEWIVKNAVNRDVERQHLNKILQDIKATAEGIRKDLNTLKTASGQQDIQAIVGEMVSNNVERGVAVSYDPQKKTLNFIAKDFTITLQGDVTGVGQVTSLGSVVIDTELSQNLMAPDDGAIYWQQNGQWEIVLPPVADLQYLEGSGIMVRTEGADEGGYQLRSIDGTVDQIDVADGDGILANPTISLSDLTDIGGGTFKIIVRDSKGRILGSSDGTTDDVPEGVINLYFTDERAQDAVGAAITAGSGDGVILTYDDVGNKIDAVNTDKGSVAVAAHEAEADPHPQYAAHTLAPSLPNVDVVAIPPGAAVARIGGGYVLADKALPDRWNVVGIYIGDTDVPVADELQPRVEGVVTMTALQWDDVLGTVGGLATGLTYFLDTAGVLSVTPPTTVGEYNVAVGLALSATDLHIRDMRPIQL